MRNQVLALLMAGSLAGCATVGPDYQAVELDLPEAWPEHVLLSDEDRRDWQQWWHQFNDPTLNGLVERAVADNLSVRLQAARIQEARARLGLSRAEQLPTVGAQAEASRDRQLGAGGEPSTGNVFSIAGLLSYEIDLWGRLSREQEAAEAILQESVYTHDAVRLNVITDVVSTYFSLRSAQRQLATTRDTLESRQETYRLERVRYEGGETDELALRQAQAELESARVQIPTRVEQVRVLESALGSLVGWTPAELFAQMELGDSTLEEIVLPTEVPAELPSDLLRRRPDLRAAEAGVMAATAGVGVAEAARLPTLNLNALLGTAASQVGDLFGAGTETWSLGASVAGPLLDFGRGKARTETAEALREQAELQYQATVNVAFREVRDALVVFETSGERVEATRQQMQAIRRALELAELRYREGYVGFIEVLDAQRTLLSAELALAEAVRDRLTATATLFKALGGGWQDGSAETASNG